MLTDTAIRKAKPAAKPYKMADARGLYVLIHPNGSRYWRWKYRAAGKEKVLSFGVYPEVTLAEARQRCDAARAKLRDGVDPSAERKAAKLASVEAGANTFGVIAAEWLAKQRASMAEVTYTKAQWLLGLAGALDNRPMREITAPEVLAILRKLEAAGTFETAHRVKQRIGQVMRYAIATGRGERDVTADLRGALTPVNTKHRAAITDPAKVGELLRALDTYTGQPATCAALKLAPLLFVRPGNLRAMEWAELDLDGAEWRIPAGKMKMKEAHVVPLPKQAVAILRDVERLTGGGQYCFASLRTSKRPMSENTINAALRRLGFDKETMTGHGFRAMASSLLNEAGWAPDVIERQLAHAERNKVRAAYNRASYMAERKRMLQWWADYLDTLKAGTTNVVPIRKGSAA
jgi:integrase